LSARYWRGVRLALATRQMGRWVRSNCFWTARRMLVVWLMALRESGQGPTEDRPRAWGARRGPGRIDRRFVVPFYRRMSGASAPAYLPDVERGLVRASGKITATEVRWLLSTGDWRRMAMGAWFAWQSRRRRSAKPSSPAWPNHTAMTQRFHLRPSARCSQGLMHWERWRPTSSGSSISLVGTNRLRSWPPRSPTSEAHHQWLPQRGLSRHSTNYSPPRRIFRRRSGPAAPRRRM
jgi:hypothetical protein